MIQRIQTLYLALVAIFCTHALFLYTVYFHVAGNIVATISNIRFRDLLDKMPDEDFGPWPLAILLVLVIVLNIVSILLFRKRMRQLRLTVFSTLLLAGYLLAFAFCTWLYTGKVETAFAPEEVTVSFGIAVAYPIVSIILNCLAISGIRKDEALVRSLDRLR